MEAVVERTHELIVEDESGDTRHTWDPEKPFEVERIRTLFNEFKQKGYIIYRVDRDGGRGELMHRFDPDAAKMIAHEALQAG